MKKRVVAILLCLSCMAGLTACGEDKTVSERGASEIAQTFGNAPVESPNMAQTVPEEDSAGGQVAPQPEEDAVSSAVTAAILCSRDGLTYDPEDPVYFWRAVGYLISICAQDDSVTVPPEEVTLAAQAMFANYSGEIPSVTEEDPLVTRTEDGDYFIHAPSLSLDLSLGEIIPTQDGYTVRAELKNGGTAQDVFQINMVDYTGPETGTQLFRYSLTGVTKLS